MSRARPGPTAWLALAGLAAVLGCRSPGPAGEAQPAPVGPEAPASAVLDPTPQGCARCHLPEYERWQGSLHAQAWSDPVFQAEYAPAPSPWCRACHDPPSQMADNPSHGIDCATCHLRGATILASATSPAAEAAHPIALDGELSSSQRCARCHQFNYSDDGIHDPREALQNTLAEWRASDAAAAGEGCVSCHLRGHAFVGLSDPELLAEAVEVELSPRRTAAGVEVEVDIRGREIGHAFPTGDVFRVARLSLHARDPEGAAVAEGHLDMKRWLGRSADPDGLDSHVRTLADTRVPPPGQGSLVEQVELALDPAQTVTSISWTLELHRLAPRRARARGLDEDFTRVRVAAGRVELPTPGLAADGE